MSETTVNEFIEALDEDYDNSYSDAQKVRWINELEKGVYTDINEEYRSQFYPRVKGSYQFTLPTGVDWEDVAAVYVANKKYDKRSLLSDNNNYSYYYDQTKLNISPVPTINDTTYTSGTSEIIFKAISYTSGASEITFAHNTITTTGTAFTDSAFVVGATIWISGCLDTENNKTAVITAVAANVLTFADYTFDADTTADTGTINLATNCIYTSGAEFSGFVSDEYILVSGCTDETANNKYALVYAVEDSVLTFATGTFTAQEESAAVTISQPKIRMIYRYKRDKKDEDDIDTDTLLLPDRFEQAYYYYCYAKMAMLDRDFSIAQNWMDQYNKVMEDYELWWEDHRPLNEFVLPDDSWGSPYDTSEDE